MPRRRDSYVNAAEQVMTTQRRERGPMDRGGHLREVSLSEDMMLAVWSMCDRRVHIVAAVWIGCALLL